MTRRMRSRSGLIEANIIRGDAGTLGRYFSVALSVSRRQPADDDCWRRHSGSISRSTDRHFVARRPPRL